MQMGRCYAKLVEKYIYVLLTVFMNFSCPSLCAEAEPTDVHSINDFFFVMAYIVFLLASLLLN